MYKKIYIHNVFHKDSELQLKDVDSTIKIHLNWQANSLKTFLQSNSIIKNKIYKESYTLKPKTVLLKNAYMDESFRIFNHKQRLMPQSLFRFQHVHNETYPTLKNENSIWHHYKKIILSIFYNDVDNQYYRFHKPALISHYKIFEHNTFHEPNTVKIYHNDAIYYSFFCYYWHIFGHFLWDIYPLFVHFWNSLSLHQKQYIKILIPTVQTHPQGLSVNFIKELLLDSGVSENQLFYVKQGHLYQFKYFYYTHQTRLNPDLYHETSCFLKNTFYNRNIQKKFQSYERLFISRKSHIGRGILNMTDVERILHKYHIKIIYIEDYSMKERINLLSNTKIIISPVSSGATHIFLTPPNTKLLLLSPHKKSKNNIAFSDHYWGYMLTFFKIQVLYQVHPREDNDDMIINLEKLERGILALLDNNT